MSGGQNWQALGAGGLYGTNTVYGSMGGGLAQARDQLDYARMGSPGRTPEAEYPDGYLGSANGRQQDKLLKKIGDLNRRAYSRGVHKGERIDPGDYVWPSEWTPERGLAAQAVGSRQMLASVGGPEPRLTHQMQQHNAAPPPVQGSRPQAGPVEYRNPRAQSELGWLLPNWS